MMQKNFSALFKYFRVELFILLFTVSLFAATLHVQASSDALAIKILPNPKHYSALRWYKEQGFTGSPQSITVDGYEGIREGRTAYVNAANITNTEPAQLYTNIYLISYNQDAESATLDIFGKLLERWKFNANRTEPGNCTVAAGSPPNDRKCLSNADCPDNEFCNSGKAKITRDVIRLSDLAEVNIALRAYKQRRGIYPKLAAGSYISGYTLSVWPSWQKLLAQELSLSLPIDPINKLGTCAANFNPATCWDEKAKRFADRFPPPANNVIDLPLNSRIYLYAIKQNGNAYNLCGIMESGFVQGVGNGACDGSASFDVTINSLNSAPQFSYSSLTGFSGSQFFGFLSAVDADDDNLTWTIDTTPTADWSSWITLPILRNNRTTGDKIIFAETAGNPGRYPVRLSVSDGKSTTTASFDLVVINRPPRFSASSFTVEASTTKPVYRDIRIDETNANKFPLTANLSDISSAGIYDSAQIDDSVPGLWSTINPPGTEYHFIIRGTIPNTQTILNPSRSYYFSLSVTDKYGSTKTEYFDMRVLNDAPGIAVIRNITTPIGHNDLVDNPLVMPVTDAQGNVMNIYLTDTMSPNAVGLNISGLTENLANNTMTISGIPTGNYPSNRTYNRTITARDEFGAETSRQFSITITNLPPVINNLKNFTAVVGKDNINHTFNVTDPDGHAIDSFTIIGLPGGVTQDAGNMFHISGTPNISTPVNQNYAVTVTATDHYGAVTMGNFSITVTNRHPVIGSFPCNTVARWHNPYSCNVSTVVSDPDGHTYTYDITGADLAITNAGIISSNLNIGTGDHLITVTVTDQYDAFSSGSYTMRVNSYCGDGTRQTPNTEGKGGQTDNGQEGCDGVAGTAATPALSNINTQYSCTGGCADSAASCAGRCVPTGGYCGDGTVQVGEGENCDPSIINSVQKCNILKNNNFKDSDESPLDCVNLNNNAIGLNGINNLYGGVCSDNCSIGCQVVGRKEYLGMGCYIGQADPGAVPPANSCQKGVWTCKHNDLVCADIFPTPMYDHCCRKLTWGQAIDYSHDFAGVSIIWPGSTYSCSTDNCDNLSENGAGNSNYFQKPDDFLGTVANNPYTFYYTFNCDHICKNRGKICVGVGVGVPQNPALACHYDTCDSGATCSTNGNLAGTDCKRTFRYWDSHSCNEAGHIFPVGSTACYCK